MVILCAALSATVGAPAVISARGDSDVVIGRAQAPETRRVSVSSAGLQGNHSSLWQPAMSKRGRYVAFTSHATNLVRRDTNERADVFVHDLQRATTEPSASALPGDRATASRVRSARRSLMPAATSRSPRTPRPSYVATAIMRLTSSCAIGEPTGHRESASAPRACRPMATVGTPRSRLMGVSLLSPRSPRIFCRAPHGLLGLRCMSTTW